jgi:uncharacterized protein YecE (DUF72 family)
MTAQIRIGTSGWHYKHWVGAFYPNKMPASRMLEYYIREFDTVELNNSFYKLPDFKTFACWRDATPEGFEFAVKASRFITHNKKLKEPQNALANFLPRAEALCAKLGPILFQLPPGWKINLERLDEFLSVLPRYHRYAFEFREPSWHVPETMNLLRRYNAAYCIYQLAGFHTDIEVTADWAYVRLHGPDSGKYQGTYERSSLQNWAERIAKWSSELKSVYVYFDNDQAGYAAHNAMELKRLISEARPSRGVRKSLDAA